MMMRTTTPVSTRSVKATAAPRIQRPTVSRPSLIVRRAAEEGKSIQDMAQQASDGQQFGDRDKQREGSQSQDSQEGSPFEGRKDQVGQGGARGLGQTEGGAGSQQSSATGQEDASEETLLTHPETFAPDQEGVAPSMMRGQQERKD